MPIYQASMSFDGVSQSPTPPTQHDAPTHSIALIARDANSPVNEFAVVAGIFVSSYGGGPTYEFKAFYRLLYRIVLPALIATGNDPFVWGALGGFTAADGGGGGDYLGGGTITIEKDFATDRLSMICPMGTFNSTLTAASNYSDGGALNPTPIFPVGFGMQWSLPVSDLFFPVFNPIDSDATVDLFNMIAKKDGRKIFGFAGSAADPFDFTGFADDSVDSVGNPSMTSNSYIFDAQHTNRYHMERATTIANYPRDAPAAASPALHNSRLYTVSAKSPPVSQDIDMEEAKEHGILYRAGPGWFQGDQLWFERSFDNGSHWGTVIIAADAGLIGGGSQYQSPSLNWANSGLYLTWYDGVNIVESKSIDGGGNWELPITIPFTGTNPRRIMSKQGNENLLFFINPGGDLVVAITYDGGNSYITGSPFLVVANVGAQQIDAEWAPDGSIVCSYTNLGVWDQKRSRDAGRSWA